jgi:4-hydroxy-tetrahydrodipicolinate reductase
VKILLIGYGKMGKAIEAIAHERGHQIAGVVDVGGSIADAPAADVAIEFTHPEAAVPNIMACLRKNLPVVVGTTGWLKRLPEVAQQCARTNGTVFYSSNFSLGVNLVFKLNEYLAQLMRGQTDYEVALDETHHTQKKDAPSGTALTLAEGILKHHPAKKSWVVNQENQPDQLLIRSHRIDPVPGTHVVTYQSPVDTIEIRHTAHSRQGFALGAVQVAEWLPGQQGVLTMDDFLRWEQPRGL